jgi:hypothetical protein
VAPVLGPQRENFGAPKQLTGKQQNPGGTKQALDLAAHDSTITGDHDLATRENLGGGRGARGPGPARAGLLRLQCSARALFRTASFKIK